MIHVYVKATGELHDIFSENSDVSGFDPVIYEVVQGAEYLESKDGYSYLGGVLTPKIAVTLTPDKAEIAADDTDAAVVAVQVAGESPPASIDIEVDGVPATVNLTDGQGTLPPITSPVEHVFEVRAADQITYTDNGGCAIAAVDQE